MATFTLATIRTRAKRLADEEYSARLVDAEWDALLDAANGELYDILITACPDNYTASPGSVTISAGTSSVDLLATLTTLHRLRGVDLVDGSDYVPLGRFNFRERYNTGELRYRMVQTTLHVHPTEDAPGTYRIWYIPVCPTFTTSVTYPDGWEEYLVVSAAIAAGIKEETDVGVLMARKAELAKRIREAASDNDVGEPGTVSDVRGFEDPLGQWWWL